MAYSDKTDLQNAKSESILIQLSDDNGVAINDAVVDSVIARADALIDSYISNRYEVPVTPTPEILTNYSIIIASYYLYKRANAIPDDVVENFNKVLAELERLRNGESEIPGVSITNLTGKVINSYNENKFKVNETLET